MVVTVVSSFYYCPFRTFSNNPSQPCNQSISQIFILTPKHSHVVLLYDGTSLGNIDPLFSTNLLWVSNFLPESLSFKQLILGNNGILQVLFDISSGFMLIAMVFQKYFSIAVVFIIFNHKHNSVDLIIFSILQY